MNDEALFEIPPMISETGLATIAIEKLAALSDVPHPFPYQGSKRMLAHAVLRYLPDDIDRLVEPFAGSAAISIATRFAGLASTTSINDVNAPLMGLWSRILDDPNGLAEEYTRMWEASVDDPKAYFFERRATFNETQDPAILLYLLNRIVKGAVRYSRSGDFNQSADNRRLGAKPATVQRRLLETSKVMRGTEVTSESYERLLVEAGPRDVVYMDPPYQGVSNVADRRYMSGLERVDFELALQKANANGVSYIVSYDEVREDSKYGERLSDDLGLTHLHITVGRSSQATLSGRADVTTESIYLSPALVDRLGLAQAKAG